MTIENTPALTRGGKTSRWSAAFNPVQFTFKMSDGDKSTRKNQRFVVHITSGSNNIEATYYADKNERAICDIAAYLQSLVSCVDVYNHMHAYHFDTNLFAEYTIKVKEQWDDAITGALVDNGWVALPDSYFVVFAAMQVGESGGGNLIDYVLFAGQRGAKYLTYYDRPMSYNDFPTDLSVIVDKSLKGKELIIKFTAIDINYNILPDNFYVSYLLNETGGYLQQEDGSKIILENSVNGQTEVNLEYGVLRFRIPDVMQGVTNVKIEIYYLNNSELIKVAEDKLINTIADCERNGVLLKWINPRGGWDYYRFGFNQTIWGTTTNEAVSSSYISNWETTKGEMFVSKKYGERKVRLYARNLAKDHAHALQILRYSPQVEMLVTETPEKWIVVIVNDGDIDPYNTNSAASSAQITLTLPQLNIQRQ